MLAVYKQDSRPLPRCHRLARRSLTVADYASGAPDGSERDTPPGKLEASWVWGARRV